MPFSSALEKFVQSYGTLNNYKDIEVAFPVDANTRISWVLSLPGEQPPQSHHLSITQIQTTDIPTDSVIQSVPLWQQLQEAYISCVTIATQQSLQNALTEGAYSTNTIAGLSTSHTTDSARRLNNPNAYPSDLKINWPLSSNEAARQKYIDAIKELLQMTKKTLKK